MIRSLATLSLALLLTPALPAASEPPVALEDTIVTCDHFESVSTDKEMTTYLTGHVVVTGTNIKMTCDRMEIISLRSGPKDQLVSKENQFKSLFAFGHVKIVQGERVATCEHAEVLPGENKIILRGTPMVEDTERKITWTGEDLELLRGERRVLGKNATIHLPPMKDLSFGKDDKTSPAPDTKPKQ